MADIYAELGKLRRVIEELQPIADASAENHEKFVKAEEEAAEWKRVGMEAVNAKKDMGERLEEERKLKSELGRQYDLRMKETEMANKKVERLMMDAKFDKQAREGQVKRSRIIQHELEETRQINGELEEKSNMLESKNSELTRALNHERALRLQDLHRNMAMAGAKKLAENSEKDLEGRAANVSSELEDAHAKMRMMQATIRGMEKVAASHEEEMLATRAELEMEKKEGINLRTQLTDSTVTLEASVAAQRELEAETSRLRREVIMTAHGSANAAATAVLAPRDARAQRRLAQERTDLGRANSNSGALTRSQSNHTMDFGQDYNDFDDSYAYDDDDEGEGAEMRRSQPAGNARTQQQQQQRGQREEFGGGGGGGGGRRGRDGPGGGLSQSSPLEPGRTWREHPSDPFAPDTESLGTATRAYRSHSAAVASRVKSDERARYGLQHFGASSRIVGGEGGAVAMQLGSAVGDSGRGLEAISSRQGGGSSATPARAHELSSGWDDAEERRG